MPRNPVAEADETYLDGRITPLQAFWAGSTTDESTLEQLLGRPLLPIRDDFVRLPLPRLAAEPKSRAALGDAVKKYEQEAAVVDPRLFRKVTLELKGATLDNLCAHLKEQTGVELRASRGVGDEKVTVFLKERPAREVMREVARLFGFHWLRSGVTNAYKYELVQDLRSQLAEEELRNRDAHAALLAMDEQLGSLRPLLELPAEELDRRFAAADRTEQRRMFSLVTGGLGGVRLYDRLSPAQRTALISGQELAFTPNAPNPDFRLPLSWSQPILQSSGYVTEEPGLGTIPLAQAPGAAVRSVRLKLDRSELGQITLKAYTAMIFMRENARLSSSWETNLATGRSPSAAQPKTDEVNERLRKQPPFNRTVLVHPQPSCHGTGEFMAGEKVPPHLSSADVWEAVYRESGQPIIADYYSHAFPLAKVATTRKTLFEALCEAGDRMGVRWKQDGDYLLCRSTSYFWDKLKEVPTRLLERWQREQRANHGLPLESLLEMSTLSDQQLDSATVGEVVIHCWGLEEWDLVGRNPRRIGMTQRTSARFLASLTPDQRLRTRAPKKMAFYDFLPAQQQGLLAILKERNEDRARYDSEATETTADQLSRATFDYEYFPSGWFVWRPSGGMAISANPAPAPTREAALAEARRYYPEAGMANIGRTLGELRTSITFHYPARQ